MRVKLRHYIQIYRRQLMWLGLGIVVLLLLFVRLPGKVEKIDSYDSCARAGYVITQTDPPVCHGPQHAYAGPVSPAGSPQPGHTSQGFQTYVDGDSGNSYPRSQQVIDNQADWAKYWRAIHAGKVEVPPILDVDFTKFDVVAISEGSRLTDGYRLKITAVLVSSSGSIVDVSEQIPTLTCNVANTSTNRYFIVTTAKLPRPVSFAIDTGYRQCPK